MPSRLPNMLWRAVAKRASRPEAARVGEADFRFFGFRDRPEATLFSRFDYLPTGRPPLLELRDVLFLPDHRCLYDLRGARIEASKVTYVEDGAPAWFNEEKFGQIERQTMPERIAPPAKAARIKDPVLFLGEVHDHYGHFITDSMSRMWALDELPAGLKVLFTPDPGLRLETPLVRRLMGAVGIEETRLLRPDGPTVFDKLYCPIGALQLSRIYQRFEAVHRRAAEALMRGGVERPTAPVYLTRSGLQQGLRRLKGEAELERRLEREGFVVVSPERLDLASQMAIFNSPHPVVGPFGSAMHTVLFRTAERGAGLATLFPGKVPPRFMMVDAIKGAEAAYIRCIRFEGEESEGGSGWVLDPDAAMAHLDAAGLLARRSA